MRKPTSSNKNLANILQVRTATCVHYLLSLLNATLVWDVLCVTLTVCCVGVQRQYQETRQTRCTVGARRSFTSSRVLPSGSRARKSCDCWSWPCLLLSALFCLHHRVCCCCCISHLPIFHRRFALAGKIYIHQCHVLPLVYTYSATAARPKSPASLHVLLKQSILVCRFRLTARHDGVYVQCAFVCFLTHISLTVVAAASLYIYIYMYLYTKR